MENKLISMEVPNDILYELTSMPTAGKTVEEKLKVNLAIGLFASRGISLAKAAQLAGKSLAGFINILNIINIPAIDYTEDMLKDDIEFIKNYKSESTKV